MAVFKRFTCSQCGQPKSGMFAPSDDPEICGICQDLNNKEAKKKELARLASLTIPERIALLEEKFYDLERRPQPIHPSDVRF